MQTGFRAVVFATLLTTIAVATSWFITAGGATSAAAPFRTDRTESTSQQENQPQDASRDCSAHYAALLDLAELARREGKSSGVVVRGLSDRRGALSGCLRGYHTDTARP